jgi:hypothetical protein
MVRRRGLPSPLRRAVRSSAPAAQHLDPDVTDMKAARELTPRELR